MVNVASYVVAVVQYHFTSQPKGHPGKLRVRTELIVKLLPDREGAAREDALEIGSGDAPPLVAIPDPLVVELIAGGSGRPVICCVATPPGQENRPAQVKPVNAGRESGITVEQTGEPRAPRRGLQLVPLEVAAVSGAPLGLARIPLQVSHAGNQVRTMLYATVIRDPAPAPRTRVAADAMPPEDDDTRVQRLSEGAGQETAFHPRADAMPVRDEPPETGGRQNVQVEVDPEVRVLIGRLKHRDSTERLHAAMEIAEYGMAGAPAIPALIKALGDSESSVRLAAAAGIGGIGFVDESALAVPALVKALGDPSPAVRAEAARTLGQIATPGDPVTDVAGALKAALRDGDERVRKAAAEALDLLGY